MAVTITCDKVIFGHPDMARASAEATQFDGQVEIIRVSNKIGVSIAETPVSYLTIPVGQPCPCCDRPFKVPGDG